jgi:integrase
MKYTSYPSITQFQQLVELKDYRQPTKKEYVRYVRKLAEHFQCDPATLTQDQLREYFLFLRQHKHYSRSPMKMAKYALLCFYVECLKVTGWTVFREGRIAEPQVLPIVLSRAEVKRLLAAVREPRFRACLGLMYHCGLRVGEAVRIRVKDILGREQPAPPVGELRQRRQAALCPDHPRHGRRAAGLVADAPESHVALSHPGARLRRRVGQSRGRP